MFTTKHLLSSPLVFPLSTLFIDVCPLSQVLDILQHIQALDPSQHGAVGYLVQHTLEHIQHKKHPVMPEVKKRSAPEHLEVQYSVGLIMKHKRWVTRTCSAAILLCVNASVILKCVCPVPPGRVITA